MQIAPAFDDGGTYLRSVFWREGLEQAVGTLVEGHKRGMPHADDGFVFP